MFIQTDCMHTCHTHETYILIISIIFNGLTENNINETTNAHRERNNTLTTHVSSGKKKQHCEVVSGRPYILRSPHKMFKGAFPTIINFIHFILQIGRYGIYFSRTKRCDEVLRENNYKLHVHELSVYFQNFRIVFGGSLVWQRQGCFMGAIK